MSASLCWSIVGSPARFWLKVGSFALGPSADPWSLQIVASGLKRGVNRRPGYPEFLTSPGVLKQIALASEISVTFCSPSFRSCSLLCEKSVRFFANDTRKCIDAGDSNFKQFAILICALVLQKIKVEIHI